jgi:CRP/FNR family transcriptional regulator, cyclic AMP receptor protein
MARPHIVAKLAETDLFAEVDLDALGRLSDHAIEREYRRGQIVFSQGDVGDSLFVLTEGVVMVVLSAETGDQMVLTTLRPTATFGELSLVDGRPRSASVEAVETSKVIVVNRPAWQELIVADRALADGVTQSLAAMLRRLTDQASDFVFLDLPGRLAKFLVRAYESQGEGPELDLSLNQSDLANAVGGSRQSVNQILGHLAGRGLIEVQGRTIVIHDAEALKRRAGL